MGHHTGRWQRSFAAMGAAVPLLVGCGSSSGPAAAIDGLGADSAAIVPVKAPAGRPGQARPVLPDVAAVRVATGETVNLRDLALTGKPTLLWFWAPHCPVCRAMSPDVRAFAAEYGSRIQIVGLGAQDDLNRARSFLKETDTSTLEMVWDRTGRSWIHFEARHPSTLKVLDSDGKVRRTWVGKFDRDAVRTAAGVR
jgi:thiol-disulfide isomerase/thioredoxin